MNPRAVRSLAAGALAIALAWYGGTSLAWADETPGAAAPAADSVKAALAADSVKAAPAADSAKAALAADSANAAPASGEKAPAKGKALEKGKPKAAAKKAAARGKEKTMGALPGTMPVRPSVEPQHVTVQHILIGFRGSVPGKDIQRTKGEAKKLAYEILERARKGEGFDGLVRQYTDDSPPGIYGMSGNGVPPAPGEFPRGGMVPAFGNVGFTISPGNIGIADFDVQSSPYGWHVIKRLK